MKGERGRTSVRGQMVRSPSFWLALGFSTANLIFGTVLSLRWPPRGTHLDAMLIVMLWDVAQWGIFIKYRHWLKLTDASNTDASNEDKQLLASSFLKGALVELVILNNIVIVSMLSCLASGFQKP